MCKWLIQGYPDGRMDAEMTHWRVFLILTDGRCKKHAIKEKTWRELKLYSLHRYSVWATVTDMGWPWSCCILISFLPEKLFIKLVFFPKFRWNICFLCFYLFLQAEFIFIIKMHIIPVSLHTLYVKFTCSSFVQSVSKVSVCFPSGIYIGTDRQCDKWHWINPFLNAFRDVSAPLVTHTRDLC